MKTKKQLLEEIDGLQRKVDKLGKSESENRRIMKILRDSEREKMAILDAMFELVMLLDRNLTIIWTNKAVSQHFGLDPKQLQGMHCYTLFNNLNQPCRNCAALKSMDDGKIINIKDQSFLGKRWTVRHYPLNREKKLLQVCTDITESKAAEEALRKEQAQKDIILAQLRQSEEKYKRLFEDSRDAIFIMDKEGQVVEANQACLNLFEIMREDLDNINVWDFVFVSARRDKFVRDIEQNKSVMGYPARMRKSNGARIDCLLTASVKYGQDGSIRGYQGIIRDITEQKKLEKEVLEISERERRDIGLELHDDLGQLLTGIALKSKSLAQTLRKKSLSEAIDVQKLTDLANEAISKTRQMIKGFVPAGFESGDIVAALEELAVTLSSNYGISCTVHSNLPGMDFDNVTVPQLYRIAQEAAINAAKHGKARCICITLDKVDSGFALSIKDDGIGFPSDNSLHEGRGLHIMAYRARMIDAALSIRKNQAGGMTVICTLRDKKSGHEYDVVERISQKLSLTSG